MTPKYKFTEGEKVLCFHGPLIYEAKALKSTVTKDKQIKYYIHYAGWNKNWDEWVPENRVLKYNEANVQKQKEVFKQHSSSAGKNKKGTPKNKKNDPTAVLGKDGGGASSGGSESRASTPSKELGPGTPLSAPAAATAGRGIRSKLPATPSTPANKETEATAATNSAASGSGSVSGSSTTSNSGAASGPATGTGGSAAAAAASKKDDSRDDTITKDELGAAGKEELPKKKRGGSASTASEKSTGSSTSAGSLASGTAQASPPASTTAAGTAASTTTTTTTATATAAALATPTAAAAATAASTTTSSSSSNRLDPFVESEETFLTKIEVKIKIPDELKQCLTDDWDAITRQHKLIDIPAKITVQDIVDQYIAYKKTSKTTNATKEVAINDVLNGVVEYFNVMLGSQLLYKFERPQYADILQQHPETPLSKLYGSFHLLRLFVKLGSMLGYSALDEKAMQMLLVHLHDFLKFLVKNSATYFSMANFINVSPEYHRNTQ